MILNFFSNFLNQLLQHIERLLNSIYGYLLIAVTMFLNFIEPEKFSFAVVFAAIVFDLFWGVLASLKLGKFVYSKLLRETPLKIGAYAFSLITVYMIENILHDSSFIFLKIVAAIAAACELWSMSASILIICPNLPFLRILRLQLKGEIESKTGQKLDDILHDKSKNNE